MKLTLLLFLASGVLTAACAAPEVRQQPDAEPVTISSADAVQSDLTATFEAGGVVRARVTTDVASRVLAPVVAVEVSVGDRVRQGATLVRLDARESAANRERASASVTGALETVRAAEAETQMAQAELRLARATHERISQLHARRSATSQELDQAAAALAAAEARLTSVQARVASASAAHASAQAAVKVAEIAATYADITAPFDGVVTERAVEPGSMAVPGVRLLTLEDAGRYHLELSLDQSRAAYVRVGQSVEVGVGERAAEFNGTGRILEVGRLDPVAHSFLVKVELSPEPVLRSGLFGRARFPGPARRATTVPVSALIRRGQLTFVFLVADGRVRLQPVSVGAVRGDRIEVLAGITPGARVVTEPLATLTDGARVRGGGQ